MLENPDNHKEYIAQIAEALDAEKTSVIDFDRLRAWITGVKSIIEGEHKMAEEIRILRDDYTARIGGMLKAVVAVEGGQEEANGLLDYLDKLPTLSAAELVTAYKKASASFRSAFPASFGLSASPPRSRRTTGDLSVYK